MLAVLEMSLVINLIFIIIAGGMVVFYAVKWAMAR